MHAGHNSQLDFRFPLHLLSRYVWVRMAVLPRTEEVLSGVLGTHLPPFVTSPPPVFPVDTRHPWRPLIIRPPITLSLTGTGR